MDNKKGDKAPQAAEKFTLTSNVALSVRRRPLQTWKSLGLGQT